MGNLNCGEKTSLNQLNEVIMEMTNQLADSKSDIFQKKKQLARQKTALVKFQKQLESEKETVNQYIKDLLNEKQQLLEEITKNGTRISELEKNLETEKKRNSEMETQFAEKTKNFEIRLEEESRKVEERVICEKCLKNQKKSDSIRDEIIDATLEKEFRDSESEIETQKNNELSICKEIKDNNNNEKIIGNKDIQEPNVSLFNDDSKYKDFCHNIKSSDQKHPNKNKNESELKTFIFRPKKDDSEIVNERKENLHLNKNKTNDFKNKQETGVKNKSVNKMTLEKNIAVARKKNFAEYKSLSAQNLMDL